MQHIIQHLFQTDSLEEVSREKLIALVEEYPSFGLGRYLLSRKLRAEGDEHFQEATLKTNLYFSNPYWLQWLLQDSGVHTQPAAETAPVTAQPAIAEPGAETYFTAPEPNIQPAIQEPEDQPTLQDPEIHPGADEPDIHATPSAADQLLDSIAQLRQSHQEHTEEGPSANSDLIAEEAPSLSIAAMALEQADDDHVQPMYHTSAQPSPETEAFAETGHLPAYASSTETPSETGHLPEQASSSDPETLPQPEDHTPADIAFAPAPDTHIMADNSSDPDQGGSSLSPGQTASLSDAPVSDHQEFPAPTQQDQPGGSHTGPIGESSPESGTSSSPNPASTTTFGSISPSVAGSSPESGTSSSPNPASTTTSGSFSPSDPESVPTSGSAPQPESIPDPIPQSGIVAPETQSLSPSSVVAAPVLQPLVAFEPYHTIDYFASQGIKLSLDENPNDKLGRQMKSFTDWLKTMRRLPQKNQQIIPDIAAEHQVRTIAAHSIEGREVVTETMAEVLAKQGMREKATEVYLKLSLLNPDKSSYFANKIEQLKID